jgi:hypothetical protein
MPYNFIDNFASQFDECNMQIKSPCLVKILSLVILFVVSFSAYNIETVIAAKVQSQNIQLQNQSLD